MLFLLDSLFVTSVGGAEPFVCLNVYVFHAALSKVHLKCGPASVGCAPCLQNLLLFFFTPHGPHALYSSQWLTFSPVLLWLPSTSGLLPHAWFCAVNVPSVDLALSLLFAWQMPAQPASPERVGCLQHDSRTPEQAAFQTDAEDLALPSAFGKKSANVNLTFNSYAASQE